MVVFAFLFLALIASANSQRFRRSPTVRPTSTFGTSPVPSVSSAPSWTSIASDSASPSGSRSPHPSASSLPSVSETRSARFSSSSTSTARLSSEPTLSSLVTTSPTFSVSASASVSNSVTRTPSWTPSVTSSPCALWYQKWHPKSQACDRTGWETKAGAKTSSVFIMAAMLVPIIVCIIWTVLAYSDINAGVNTRSECCNNSHFSGKCCVHSFAGTMATLPCFFPWIFYIMNGTIEGNDQKPYYIATGVLFGWWIFFVFCFFPIYIWIEDICLKTRHRFTRYRQMMIQLRIQRRLQLRVVENAHPVSGTDTVRNANSVTVPETVAVADGSLQCSICLDRIQSLSGDTPPPSASEEPIKVSTKLSCGHSFHNSCISTWMTSQYGTTCPLCRTRITLTTAGGAM